MPEATFATIALVKFFNHIEFDLLDRHKHHLRDTLAGLHRVWLLAAVPAGYEYLPLVIRIDEPGQVAEHKTVLMPQTRSWQQYCCQMVVANMNGDSRWYQNRLARTHIDVLVDACPHIQPGGTVSSIVWQVNFLANPWIQYF